MQIIFVLLGLIALIVLGIMSLFLLVPSLILLFIVWMISRVPQRPTNKP